MGAVEQHLRTGLAALTLAGILWVAKSVTDMQVALARAEERMGGVAQTLSRVEVQMDAVETRVRRLERGQR